ncbi:MAG TPA: DUF5698 domain-containing protein [Anaerolineales bacterium]|jgi:uncharacterized protein YebE (UPF0316 family)
MDAFVSAAVRLLQTVTSSTGDSWLASLGPWLPLVIFGLRTFDQTLSTVRFLITTQGRRGLAWILALVQSIVFLTAVGGVLGQLDNPLNLIAYAAGYGAGSVVGITIDRLLAPGHAILRIISGGRGAALVGSLRSAGYGVTEMAGQGQQGTVSLLLTAVPRRRVQAVQRNLTAIDPDAFVTAENVRVLNGGWIP